jgi:hypothetical protein
VTVSVTSGSILMDSIDIARFSSDGNQYFTTISTSVIPEPSTYGLVASLLVGCFCFCGRMRARKVP